MTSCYETLGIGRGASPADIKAAYRRMAMEHHPDRNGNTEESKIRFQEVASAYKTLSDPTERRMHDLGMDRSRSGVDAFDLFRHFFTDDSLFSKSEVGPASMRIQVPISLRAICRRKKVKISYERREICAGCRGSKLKPGRTALNCPDCRGTGSTMSPQNLLFITLTHREMCSKCKGSGKIIPRGSGCDVCSERGTCTGCVALTIQAASVLDDPNTVHARKGNYDTSIGEYGDLHAVLKVKDGGRFELRGRNLHCTLDVTVFEALAGFRRLITHPSGEEVAVDSGGYSPHGGKLVVKGKGADATGKLEVTLVVTYPPTDDRKLAQLGELIRSLGLARSRTGPGSH